MNIEIFLTKGQSSVPPFEYPIFKATIINVTTGKQRMIEGPYLRELLNAVCEAVVQSNETPQNPG